MSRPFAVVIISSTDVWSHAWEEMLVFDFSENKNKIRKSTVLVYVT